MDKVRQVLRLPSCKEAAADIFDYSTAIVMQIRNYAIHELSKGFKLSLREKITMTHQMHKYGSHVKAPILAQATKSRCATEL